MSSADWLVLFGGLGTFLYSLRLLNQSLNRSISLRFQPVLGWLLAQPWRAALTGFVVTLLFQLSSVTIIAAMGLLNSNLISLEQGFFVALGAMVGTTLKAWVFAGDLSPGPALIGASSIAYLLVRRPQFRELMEIVLAVGFVFLGLDLMAQGLSPLRSDPAFQQLLSSFAGDSLGSQFLGMLIGWGLTTMIQSSSAMVFLTMGLAADGVLTLPAAAAVILGANIGTVTPELIASLEMDWNGRRLALAYLLIKVVGVILTLFFFPAFLAVTSAPVLWLAPNADVTYRLAAVHTGFNLIGLVTWGALAPLVLRLVRSVTPTEIRTDLGLPVSVRRMLASSPLRALREADRQVVQLQVLTKNLTDACFQLLQSTPGRHHGPRRLPRDVRGIKDALDDLLFQLIRHPRADDQVPYAQQLLRFTDSCSALYYISLAFFLHLERGFASDVHGLPEVLRPQVQEFQQCFDTLWLRVMFSNADLPAADAGQAIDALEQRFVAFLQAPESREIRSDHLIWIFDTIGFFRQIARQLEDVRQMRQVLTQPAVEVS